MMKKEITSPLLLKFLKAYERNPHSRVFAPLAEHYRKAGMVDQAIIILKKGMRVHPEYALGHQTYAACLLDKKRFKDAYETLLPFVDKNRDNTKLQELFADVCYTLGYFDLALETYKYLLFINPKDSLAKSRVGELEDRIITKFQIPRSEHLEGVPDFEDEDVASSFVAPFKVDNLSGGPLDDDIDGWTQVDFQSDKIGPSPVKNDISSWKVEHEIIENSDIGDDIDITPTTLSPSVASTLDDGDFKFELNKESDKNSEEDDFSVNTPVVTHTLVDLYCAQGHVEKAYDLISKILELNPTDENTLKKHEEIKLLLGKDKKSRSVPRVQELKPSAKEIVKEIVNEFADEVDLDPQDGHDALMSHFDRSVSEKLSFAINDESEELSLAVDNSQEMLVAKVESIYQDFLDGLSRRAMIIKNSLNS